MTNKNHKNKIHKRMAKTGESWVAARRVIAQGAEHSARSWATGSGLRLINPPPEAGAGAAIHEAAGRPLREAFEGYGAGITAAWAQSALSAGAGAAIHEAADRQAATAIAAMKAAGAGAAIHEAAGRAIKLASVAPGSGRPYGSVMKHEISRGYLGLATPVGELSALAGMLDRGLITGEEFDVLKARMMPKPGDTP